VVIAANRWKTKIFTRKSTQKADTVDQCFCVAMIACGQEGGIIGKFQNGLTGLILQDNKEQEKYETPKELQQPYLRSQDLP
jgi:hypothetical protein